MTPSQQNPSRGATDARISPEMPNQTPAQNDHAKARERHLDKTIADSFPASDPPSTDPNPDGDE